MNAEMQADRLARVPRSCICRWERILNHWIRCATADGCPWHTIRGAR